MPRGILATCSAPLTAGTSLTADEAYDVYAKAYADEPFVHVLPQGQWPQTKSVTGSNAVHLQVSVDQDAGRLVAVGAVDNLAKGTAGAAVQCMNLALGLDRRHGPHHSRDRAMTETTETSRDPTVPRPTYELQQFPEKLAVIKLPAGAEIPSWAESSSLFSITATATETSLVCAGRSVPDQGAPAPRG